MKPVCLVMGAGAGIGGNVARRFAQEGYHAVLCRRSDLEGLNKLVDAIKEEGGSATGFLLNADAPDTLGKMLGPERFQRLRETRATNTTDSCCLRRSRKLIFTSRNSTDRHGRSKSTCARFQIAPGGIIEDQTVLWDANVLTT